MNRAKRSILILSLFLTGILATPSLSAGTASPDSMHVTLPDIIVSKTDINIGIVLYKDGEVMHDYSEEGRVRVNGEVEYLNFLNGRAELTHRFDRKQSFRLTCDKQTYIRNVRPIPLWMSVIPPLIAILFALIFKEVFSALVLGIFSGTLIISMYQFGSFFKSLLNAFLRLIDTYIIQALNDAGHLSIIVFSMLIGGMVGIITKNGGMQGIVAVLSRRAKTSRSGQLVTWLMGLAIFFDDYANTLVVGNTMRNVTDKLRISREKLAYIVDSTAAPIASIAFITTWIGAELSYIQDGISTIGLDTNPYSVFFASLKYSFYPIMALLFVLMIVMTRRDFGPMFKIELNARKGIIDSNQKQTSEKQVKKSASYNALIPVLVIVFGTITGLIYSGWDSELWHNPGLSIGAKLSHIIGEADSFKALLWSSFAGVLVAITLTVSQKLLNLRKTIDAMVGGFKSMLTAILILTFAWSLALLTEHLHTAEFISTTMRNLSVSPYLIPTISFVFSAAIAFSTGSSWGTMAIMYPLILPSSWLIFAENGLDHATSMMLFNNLVSTVIAGSVLGDHCSPISDTTILSSLASGCSHIQHVRTQMPYALTVGSVAVLTGTLPAAYGFPVYISIPAGLLILYLILRIFGKKLPLTKL
ncbi:MAG: Na+/H+ antiporter NhaC family protein [Bacteroidota bacterium]